MKKTYLIVMVLLFTVAAPVFAQGGYDEFYDRVFGNGDQAYTDYSAEVPVTAPAIKPPYPRCLLVFAGIRNGQPFLDFDEDTITVYSGQYFYITPVKEAKGKITITAGDDFNKLFTADTDASVRSDRAYIAQKSGHAVIEISYAGLTKKIEINVITWRNFTLINDQLKLSAFVGDIFFVKLPCNVKSGYDWYPAASWNKEMFAVLDSGYTKTDNPNSSAEHYWLVRALTAGQGEMKFEYHRDKKNDFNLLDCSLKVTVEGY